MQRVFVTAGAGGIGASISTAFANAGAKVAICDLDSDALERFRSEYPDILSTHADVGCEVSATTAANWALKELGGIDILINNAGIAGPTDAIESIGMSDWRRCIDVNLGAAFLFSRCFVPHLKAQRSGTIINISSISATQAIPHRAPYVAAKAGLEGLTRAMARELGPFNIRCNAILPGFVESARSTEIMRRLAETRGVSMEEVTEEALRFISLRRKVSAEDIARMCVFLASDSATCVTGQLVAVDGNVEWEG